MTHLFIYRNNVIGTKLSGQNYRDNSIGKASFNACQRNILTFRTLNAKLGGINYLIINYFQINSLNLTPIRQLEDECTYIISFANLKS